MKQKSNFIALFLPYQLSPSPFYISLLPFQSSIAPKTVFLLEAMIALLAICVSLVLLFPLTLLYKLWWVPLHLQHIINSQGIKGPSYKFLHGNTKEAIKIKKQSSNTPMDLSHDIYPRVQPHLYSWMKLYGNNFVHWIGTQPYIVVTEAELIKEVLSNKEGTYPKTKLRPYMKKLFGDGIVGAEGEKWLRLRKLSNHAFHGECLKDMIPAMIASVESMLENWRFHENKEIDVCSEFRLLTSEVISRTAFGSSYLEGGKIFDLLTDLCALISRNADKIRFFGVEYVVSAFPISWHCASTSTFNGSDLL